MRMIGMGDEGIRLGTAHELRRLHELPHDVEVVRILPNRDRSVQYDPWRPTQVLVPHLVPIFVHVRHRYCSRVPAGAHMSYDTLTNFLKRYFSLLAYEAEMRTKTMAEVFPEGCGDSTLWEDTPDLAHVSV